MRIWRAASSIASGSPSSRAHTVAITQASSSVTENDGSTARARSTNNRTASRCRQSAPSRSTGNGSGRTGNCVSPGTRRLSRLVASTLARGQAASTRSTRVAAPSMTCSQLSSTTSTGAPWLRSAISRSADMPDPPTAADTAPPTNESAETWPRLTHQIPPRYERCRW